MKNTKARSRMKAEFEEGQEERKAIMREQVKQTLDLDAITVSKPKRSQQSNSDWQTRQLDNAELDAVGLFEDQEVTFCGKPLAILNSESFKVVFNKVKGREFIVLTDTGAKSLKLLRTLDLDGIEYKLMFRLTLNLEQV